MITGSNPVAADPASGIRAIADQPAATPLFAPPQQTEADDPAPQPAGPGTVWAAAALRATSRLIAYQDPKGRWDAEVVWCPVITAKVILANAIMRRPVPPERARLILRHFARTRHPEGGWGLHPESHPYLFVTTLVYVASRLLGEAPDSPLLTGASAWLARHPQGLGALPSWGRFWLSLLGLCDRDRLTPCPPELFLLPGLVNRLYCHTRYIYLGMACLSGLGLQADLGPIAATLRKELAAFTKPGPRPRHEIAATDLYVPPGRALRLAYDALAALGPVWRRLPGTSALRRRAVDRCLRRIAAEQSATNYQALSPVNGILNTLALWARDPAAPETAASIAGLDAWCWQDDTDGLRYAGARSTAWDTAFALQALTAARHPPPEAVRKGYAALAALQLAAPPSGLDEGRQDPTGGWCFGEPTHGWTVSDCTAEAIGALVQAQRVPGLIPPEASIPPERLASAFRFLLARQNRDGGFATYERRRGGKWLEHLNPSEMFGQCMTERSYIECTASAIRALCHVAELPPGTLAPPEHAACTRAMTRAQQFLLARQRPDGAWPGFWGINFAYATGFAIAALRDLGLPSGDPAIRRAAAWLTAVQQPDGGWGEHFSGCLSGTYVPAPNSLVIMTSWAVLALLRACDCVSPEARRGLDWLAARQLPDGDWPRDSVNGVFFGTAMLDYRLYNTYFPARALNMAAAMGTLRTQ